MKAQAVRLSASILVLLLGACSSPNADNDPAKSRSAPSVAVKMFTFTPPALTVRVGEVVTWTNHDEILHTATSGTPDSPSRVFDGTMDGQGESFSFIFDAAGTYPYFCSRHNGMTGKIVVSA